MRKILVPLDGSARAASVLPAAASFARALGSELLLLWVVEPEKPPGTQESAAHDYGEAHAEARAYLEQVAADIRGPGLPVTTSTAFGHPPTRIMETVCRDPLITRLVMAARDTGEESDQVVGRTTEDVLRTAGVSVLLVRGGHTRLPLAAGSIVLVPFDGTAFARQALNEAQSIAAAAGATLLLVSILPVLDCLSQARQASAWFIEAGQREANRITRELEQVTRRIAATGLPVRSHLAHGQPAAEIANLATACGASLIVMGTHGQTGAVAHRWGSVTLAVLRLVAVPVLLRYAPRTPALAGADELERGATRLL